MDNDEPLGEGTERYIASCVADGTASPEEARRLIVEFVRQADSGKVSATLIGHLADCFRAFLNGRKALLPAPQEGRDRTIGVPIQTLEKAFGIKRVAPGRPRVDDDTLSLVAMEALERLLKGESLEEASEAIAEERKQQGEQVSSKSQVQDAWASHKTKALWFARAHRALNGEGWSGDELSRIQWMFTGHRGVVPLGMPIEDYWRMILPDEPLPTHVTPENSNNKTA